MKSLPENWELLLICLLATAQFSAAATPFKFVIFGDTQNYTAAANNGAPDLFTIQTQWVKNNAVSENIAF